MRVRPTGGTRLAPNEYRLSQFWLLFAALSLVLGAGYLAGPCDAVG